MPCFLFAAGVLFASGGVGMQGCNYDKTKLIHEISETIRFLDVHAKEDSEASGHPLCGVVYDELRADLMKHLQKLNLAVAGLANEGKYV